MRHWKKTSLLTTLVILVLAIGLIYLFNISIAVPSSDIEFSPSEEQSPEVQLDSLSEKPEHLILFIADGMGFSHLSLALLTQQLDGKRSVWEEFDVKGWHDPRSGNGPLTDSEASATAIATGTSTSFGHIGIDKDGNVLENIFEVASNNEYNTAIVTDSYIWDGTPAAFTTHTRDEDDARDILTQLAASDLDLLFGELEDLGEDKVPEEDETLEILSKRFLLLDKTLELPSPESITKPIAAIYDEDEVQDLNSSPNLPKLTDVALNYLDAQDKPFVLLVECEEIDSASHTNDSERVLNGLRSIQETLSLILTYSKTQGRTLVLFTADHETGGLAAVADFDNYPNMQMKWSTKAHSAAVVPFFAKGPGAENFSNIHRNREIGLQLKKLISQNKE